MSDTLVRWVDALPDGTVRDDIQLFDDGTVERIVGYPAGAMAPTIGWFRGTIDDDMLRLARSVADVEVVSGEVSPRPQAGGWVASTEQASVALWGEGGDATTAALRSLLAVTVEAADDAETAVRFTAAWTTVGSERAPLLSLENVGSTPAWCAIDPLEGVDATFLDTDGRALGFLGSSMSLDGGARGNGLLIGWSGGDSLALDVRVARPDEETLSGRVVVSIA